MNLGIWLEEKYGKDSVAMLVDEGSNMEFLWGQLYATPAVAEKGMLDVEIRVETAGGHSSVPRASILHICVRMKSLTSSHPHRYRIPSQAHLRNRGSPPRTPSYPREPTQHPPYLRCRFIAKDAQDPQAGCREAG
jgi:acetylornithine deacetylase/succinyl-diaminopimelate desuccinylase-like protein